MSGAIETLEAERNRLREALEKIAGYWGKPMPLGTSDRELLRMWMEDCNHLRAIAHQALETRA